MKKLISLLLALACCFSLSACAQTPRERNILVAYFSWSGNSEEMAS